MDASLSYLGNMPLLGISASMPRGAPFLIQSGRTSSGSLAFAMNASKSSGSRCATYFHLGRILTLGGVLAPRVFFIDVFHSCTTSLSSVQSGVP